MFPDIYCFIRQEKIVKSQPVNKDKEQDFDKVYLEPMEECEVL